MKPLMRGLLGGLLVALTVLTNMAYADMPPVRFKHLTINEGLSQNTVYAILQDHEGFIWIGTEDGLNKYDGYEFTIYRHVKDNNRSLSENQVNDLLEDTQGNLWIATTNGIDRYNRLTNDFTRIYTIAKKNGGSSDFVNALAADKAGHIWIGTLRGLREYNPVTHQISFYKPGGPYNQSKKIQTLFTDATGKLWVGTDKELQLFDIHQRRFIQLPVVLAQNAVLRSCGIRKICRDPQGRYWLGTEAAGLYNYDPVNNTCINYRQANGLLSDIVRDILVINDDELWIGTRDGLSVLKNGKFANYQYDKYNAEALSHNSIRHFMRDRSGNVWVGTFAGGLNMCSSESGNFNHIAEQVGQQPGLSHRVVSALIDNGNNTFWIGTEGGGLNFADRNNNSFKSYPIVDKGNELNSNNIKSLCKDNKGNLWVGMYDGLVYFNTTSNTYKIYKSPRNYKRPSENQIYALYADANGLWIGTNGAGLQLMDNQGRIIKNYTHNERDDNSISDDNISVIKKDANGAFWIGTQRGLNKFNPATGKFKHFKYNEQDRYSLPNNAVSSIYIDANQRIWVGTQGGGLSMLDTSNNRFYSIDEKNGLANSVVHAIICDNRGDFWISSNKGISRIDFKNPATPFSGNAFNISNYSVADGLLSNQFSSGSVFKDHKGTLYFGSIIGITCFNPSSIRLNRFKPPVVFTDFLIRNRSVGINAEDSPLKADINETRSITLTHDQGFISFKFAALNYVNPDKNSYAYKMEGFNGDDDWHYVGNQRTATYTNLNAGTYYFKVKAANNDGVWNNNIKTIKLIVLPPWYKTWLAYLFYALAIIGLLYVFYFYSVKTAHLKNALAFEHLSHEKDQELTQRKLTFFTNISHEIKTPLTLILAPLEKLIGMNEGNNKIQNQLMLMQRNGERLIRLINQLLDFRKFESGSMTLQAAEGNIARFVNEIFIAFESYAQSKKIDFKFKSETDRIIAYYDRDKLEKILYNLLSNALKFTQDGGTIILTIDTLPAKADAAFEHGAVVIKVEDNGPGIAPENRDKIFDRFAHFSDPKNNVGGTGLGLSFSKGLAELHHGTITVKSKPAQDDELGYTCFTVMLPMSKMHLQPDEIVADFRDSENIEQYYRPHSTDTLQLINTAEQLPGDAEKPIMLVVEDNPEVLNFVALTFINDYKVHTAENGLKGWEAATTLIPDIIISDVMMPEMNGTTLCSKIKSDVRTSHIPVILLSARTPIVFKIEGLETGADDYITKPFSVSVLEARVRNLVESRRILRERYKKEISLQPRNIAITSPDEKFLIKVMNYIETNIAEPSLSVEELGKEIGMSRVTLYRKIKALTNQTAIEFIRGVRIKRAAQLLEQNKFNVNEVAYMVGFIDVDYFRKCFKEQFGYTPREYTHQAGDKL